MSDGENRFARGIATLASRHTWRQLAMVANFMGYDSRERRQASIDPSATLAPTASFRNGCRIEIAAGVHVGQGSCLWAGDSKGRIVLGAYALLGPRVFVTASNYDFDSGGGPVMNLPKREADVVIGPDTWLGANVVVLPGVTIGAGSIVAAGAVVARDLPKNVVAAGVPARVIRARGASA